MDNSMDIEEDWGCVCVQGKKEEDKARILLAEEKNYIDCVV